jgi:cyclophilin family peptidyl-prolyl cis-trans isomerase
MCWLNRRSWTACALVLAFLVQLEGQAQALRPGRPQTTRLAVLLAEDRRGETPADIATIRSGLRSDEPETVRVALRALGRLEQPSLIADILPSLKNPFPEIRGEAANAVGQAAQGWQTDRPPGAVTALESATSALVARLRIEPDSEVRAAICETLGRMPYGRSEEVAAAEQVLLDAGLHSETVTDRLGVAKGFEALVRIHRQLRPPGDDSAALLKRLSVPSGGDAALGTRVRRLALQALVSAEAADEGTLETAAHDPDAQVRALAMRAAPSSLLAVGAVDESPIVRLEALRQMWARNPDLSCVASLAAAADADPQVALLALDQLAPCGSLAEAVAALDRAVTDLSDAGSPRGWHRAAHALVALAGAAPDRCASVLDQFTSSRIWQLRLYAARAAAALRRRDVLEKLAADDDDNVREAAVEGLRRVAGHDADALYVSELDRSGYQILRAAALSLVDTPRPEAATPALKAALARLVAEGHDNSRDVRDAITKALASAGESARTLPAKAPRRKTSRKTSQEKTSQETAQSTRDLTAEDLRRLASPIARVTVRGVGTFELALFTTEAPATVTRFVHLSEAGYYNGLSFHRVVPDFVIQGGSPGANEYIGDARFMRDEVGRWPHVRGAVGISTRGRDTGDAQIFIDLVDNPRLDHRYTVFAQVLNGIEIVDRILEGDVIERIEILHVF